MGHRGVYGFYRDILGFSQKKNPNCKPQNVGLRLQDRFSDLTAGVIKGVGIYCTKP